MITTFGFTLSRTETIRLCNPVTNSLSRRIWKHREGIGANFPAHYQCKKLIYYEHYRDIGDAIAGITTEKVVARQKIALINRTNPRWQDLGGDVLQE